MLTDLSANTTISKHQFAKLIPAKTTATSQAQTSSIKMTPAKEANRP